MSRRRRGGQTVASKGAPTDVDIMTGSIADAAATRLSDAEQYFALFKQHPWVRACVRLIGNAVGQESYDLVPIDDEAELAENDDTVALVHDFLRLGFIGKCNTFRKFRKTTVMDMQIYGAAYGRKKYAVKDGERVLAAIERMNPLRITPHLNADKTAIEYYTLKKIAGDSGQMSGIAQQFSPIDQRTLEKIPADQMMVFTIDEGGDDILPSPPPLEALDLTCGTDMSVRQHRRSFFTNGTSLGNIITSKTASDDQVRDATRKLKLMAGGHSAFRNMAIGGDWDVKSLLQSGGRDFDFIKASELTLEEICAVFSVPPSKLRDISGSMGQAGKGEDDETFEQECILPIEENFYETLTLELLEKEFEIDYFSFAPARRNKIRFDRIKAAVDLVKCGGSGNQALDLIGLPRSDDPNMDKPLFIGATAQGIVSDEIDQPQPQATPQAQQGGDVTKRDEMDGANENADEAKKAGGRGKAKSPKAWF